METKARNIQNDLVGSRDSRYRFLSIKEVTSVTNVDIMENRSIQHTSRCLPTIMEKPERLCISPILSYRESSEKVQIDMAIIFLINPKAIQMSIGNPILISRTDDPVTWVVSGKSFLQKEYQNRLSHSFQMPERKAQAIIMNCPGESGIAGVVGELWRAFGVE